MGMETGYEAGIRITGIFGNPNFMAGFLALGIFLSLYLVRGAGSRRERLAACLLLGLNTFSFLLLFSMGAVASFVVAVFLYLAAERRERRVSLFMPPGGDGRYRLALWLCSHARPWSGQALWGSFRTWLGLATVSSCGRCTNLAACAVPASGAEKAGDPDRCRGAGRGPVPVRPAGVPAYWRL